MARNNLVIIFVVIAAILAICVLTKGNNKAEKYRRMQQLPEPIAQAQAQPAPQPVPSMAGAAFVHARP
jgi:hypothetical protein